MNGHLLSIENLQRLFNHSSDIEIKEEHTSIFVYCKTITDTSLIPSFILPSVETSSSIYQSLKMEVISKKDIDAEKIEKVIFSGKLMVIPAGEKLFFYDISKSPARQPDESVAEVSIRGPKDGFVEDITTNLGLIRKRLRTKSLVVEDYTIGKRTNTMISLLYIKDIINEDILRDIQGRLTAIDVDILTSTSMLIEQIMEHKFSLIPLIDYSGRADFVSEAINQGRFAIIVDGAPTALIAPIDLPFLFKTPEDENTSFYFASLERTLRIIGLCTTTFLPGFYAALITHNVGQLPLPLIATIAVSRLGLPFSPLLEILVMLIMFELFKEGGARLPKGIGQTVAVLGGLIIGDAAIRGGITSPTTLVVIGVTAISSFTLVNQSLSGNIFFIRVFVLLFCYFMGIYGFFTSLLFVFLYLTRLKSFGVPILADISSPNGKDIMFAFFRIPFSFMKKRKASLQIKDGTRSGE
ncbi:spore germination protein [Bacillus sp. sid0103]|uniref:spore germination protein n=1 Tax=Bacillus sp. sid0103 TaxID=2856337 RepID=UPI001C490E8E|nr:spore germination protein [Bacillus sp. sid0103]MBV7507701.1 spore germination protein [Bacillus sp. sid0103]